MFRRDLELVAIKEVISRIVFLDKVTADVNWPLF